MTKISCYSCRKRFVCKYWWNIDDALTVFFQSVRKEGLHPENLFSATYKIVAECCEEYESGGEN